MINEKIVEINLTFDTSSKVHSKQKTSCKLKELTGGFLIFKDA